MQFCHFLFFLTHTDWLQSIGLCIRKLKSCVCFFTELLLNSVVYMKEKFSWHWNENADNFGTIQKNMVIHVIFRPLKCLKNRLQNFILILRHFSCGLLAATVWKVSSACLLVNMRVSIVYLDVRACISDTRTQTCFFWNMMIVSNSYATPKKNEHISNKNQLNKFFL